MNFLLLLCAIPTLCTAFLGSTELTAHLTEQPGQNYSSPLWKNLNFCLQYFHLYIRMQEKSIPRADSEAIQYVQFSPAFFPQKVTHKKAGNNNRELCCHMTSVVCGFRAEVT